MPTYRKPTTSSRDSSSRNAASRAAAPQGARVGHAGRTPAPKTGSKSPNHRGHRPDDNAAPAKRRWTADDRAARGRTDGAQGARRGHDQRSGEDRRPDWTPPAERPAKRRFGTERGGAQRPNSQRPFGERTYNDRTTNDRAVQGRTTQDRGGRPATAGRSAERSDRAPRENRWEGKPARTERPSRSGGYDRPARSFERPARSDVPARADRFERPARPARGDRFEDRSPRQGRDRDASSGFDRGDSKFYPQRERAVSTQPADDVVLDRLEAIATTASDVEGVSFGDLGLGGNIVRELKAQGAERPFAIQAATIPDVLAGGDVLGRGRTGSGKTIAFGAPLVELLMANGAGKDRKPGRKPRALILAPTRELALQIDGVIQPIARSVGVFTTQIYGGVPQGRQVGALQRGVDIIIGTPGRIEDLIEQGRLDLSEVQITVLDEADHMCDLGFLEPVQRILRETADGGQRLLFSATLDSGVAKLVDEFLVNPSVHEVAGEDQASSTIDHRVLLIDHRDKIDVIDQLVSGDNKTLIFARTRAYAEQLADHLEDIGVPATSLHGDLNQSRRTRNLALLTSGRVKVLVATDVAARGIHVDDISLVIQADAPDEYKTYLHRAGRTGRAGKKGTVVTLVPRSRKRRMDELLDRAEISAETTAAAPGDRLLDQLAAL